MRDLTNQEMLRLTGFDPASISHLISGGEIRPKVMGKGGIHGPGLRRAPSIWTPVQTLGLAIGRGLRLIGVSTGFAWPVMRAIAGMSEEKLQAEFTGGRTHIGVVGDWAFPALVTKADALENKTLTVKSINVLGELPRAIDVQLVWNNLILAVAEIDKTRKPLLRNEKGMEPGIVPCAERFPTKQMELHDVSA